MGTCLPRRVPPDSRKRLQTIVDKHTPGPGPNVPRSTQPVPPFGHIPGPGPAGPGPGPGLGMVQFWYDHWAAQGGAQTENLTNLPMIYSEHVYWNGIEQQVGTDYNLSGRTLAILPAMGAEEDDLIEVRYAYISGQTIEATIWDAPGARGAEQVTATNVTSLTVPLDSAVAAGDLLLVAVSGNGLTTWPAGWTVINNGDVDPAGWSREVAWKIAGASEPDPVISGGTTPNFAVGISMAWDGPTSVTETGPFPVSMNAIPDTDPYVMPALTAPIGRSVIVRVVLHKETNTTNNSHGINVDIGEELVQANGHRAGLSFWATAVEEPGEVVPAATATATSATAGTDNGYYTALYLLVKGG